MASLTSAAAILTLVTSAATAAPPQRFWPEFPVPQVVYVTNTPVRDADQRVTEQTLAGLLAYQARTGGPREMFWVGDANAAESAQRSFAMFVKRHQPRVEKVDGDAWELMARKIEERRVKGYILYRRDPTPQDKPATDMSLNVAVSLCAPLQAVAIEEKLKDRADRLGLRMVEDARGKDHAWLLERFSEQLSREHVALQDPRRDHNMRDLAVALSSVVVASGPGGGYELALEHARPGGLVFGWDRYAEYDFVVRASQHGLTLVPADWLLNLPLYMSGDTGLAFDLPERADARQVSDRADDPDARYVAFILSDGDNLCWTTGDLTTRKDMWASPSRGKIPFGWGAALVDAMQTNPYAVEFLRSTASPNDELVQYSTGYCYLDKFGKTRGGREALARMLNANHPFLEVLGARVMQSFVDDWNGAAAMESYDVTATTIPTLKGLFVTQYHPYAAGRGAIKWVDRAQGDDLAVLTPLIAMWEGSEDRDHFAGIRGTADTINRWADSQSTRVEDRFTWIVVHCWSEFTHADRKQTGYDAAVSCAQLLNRKVKVVTPTELVDRLQEARHARAR